MKRFLFLLILLPITVIAQNRSFKAKPIERPVSFSGTYGELRGGRFHAGYDFRVGGKVGERLYAVDDGYIARVTVSPSGYGNGLYLRISNGSLVVYGHLNNFTPEVDEIVKERQYSEKCHSVNIEFSSSDFPIKMGDYIGNVGNSGSSAAPHLHFEVRDSLGTRPINSITAGYFDLYDNIPPQINKINFYSFDDTLGIPRSELLASFRYKNTQVIELAEKSYVAIDAIDRQPGTPAKLGVEQYELFLDEEPIYCFKLNEYSYEVQKSFNSLIDYRELVSLSGSNMIKTYLEPGNRFYPTHISCKDKGLIILKDNNIHLVKVVVSDYNGNSTSREFRVRRGKKSLKSPSSDTLSNQLYRTYLPWFAPMAYAGDGLRVSLPVASLFSSMIFTVDTLNIGDNWNERFFSKRWRVGNPEIALKTSGRIEIDASLPKHLEDKALIVGISSNGRLFNCGGRYENGKVCGKLSSFGTYAVVADTIAPTIHARFKSSSSLTKSGQASFTIKDDLSGISKYDAYIDNEWILAEYDAKYKKLTVDFKRQLKRSGKERILKVVVSDNKNNTENYICRFKW